jgi:hypothetical protein
MKQITMKFALLTGALLLATLWTSCIKEPIDWPAPGIPQQPFPLPATGLIKQIKYSENDYTTIGYNAQGLPEKMVRQWQYVQNDPSQIAKVEYLFSYDVQNRLTELKQGPNTVKIMYNTNNMVEKSEERNYYGELVQEINYLYNNNRIVEERWKMYNGTGAGEYKHLLSSDNRGNRIKVEKWKRDAAAQFVLLETIEYEDFDTNLNTTNWMLRFPYLPQVRWQFNNPRVQRITFPGGPAFVTTFNYTYNNALQMPLSRSQSNSSGTLNANYTY